MLYKWTDQQEQKPKSKKVLYCVDNTFCTFQSCSVDRPYCDTHHDGGLGIMMKMEILSKRVFDPWRIYSSNGKQFWT